MEATQENREEEITFKEVILKASEYFLKLKKNASLVVFIASPVLLFYVYTAVFTPVLYNAELTFTLNDGNGTSAMGGILSQFGLEGGGKGKSNIAKMLELAKSRTIIKELLFDEIIIDGKEDFLANHLILEYDYHDTWEGDKANFLFKNSDIDSFSIIENSVLKTLHHKIVNIETGLVEMFSDKKTGIVNCVVETTNEDLSFFICQNIYDILSQYYVDRAIEKQLFTYNIVNDKVDSLHHLIKVKEYQLADFKDTKKGLYTTKSQLEKKRLQRELQILNASYLASLKNLEVSDFSLKTATPLIQIIDKPLKPLKIIKQSLVENIVIGSVLGLFIGSLIVLLRLVYFDLMDEK